MNKMMDFVLVCLMILFYVICAAPLSWAGQWIGPGTIQRLEVQPNSNVYVQVSMTVPDMGCPYNTGNWIQLDTAAPHYKEQYSLLITALIASRQVSFYIDGCGAYPYAQSTDLF